MTWSAANAGFISSERPSVIRPGKRTALTVVLTATLLAGAACTTAKTPTAGGSTRPAPSSTAAASPTPKLPTAEIGKLPVLSVTGAQTVRPTWTPGGDVAVYANATLAFIQSAIVAGKVSTVAPQLRYVVYNGAPNVVLDCGDGRQYAPGPQSDPVTDIAALWCPKINAIVVNTPAMHVKPQNEAGDRAFYDFLLAVTDSVVNSKDDSRVFACDRGLVYRGVATVQPALFPEVAAALNSREYGGGYYDMVVLAFLKGNCEPNV
jgi:hypothetical protein